MGFKLKSKRFKPFAKVLMRRVWRCTEWQDPARAALRPLRLWPVTKSRAVHFPYFPRRVSALTCRDFFNGGRYV